MKPISYPQSQISSSSLGNPATSVSVKIFLSVFQPFGEILTKLLSNIENELQVAFRHYVVALKNKQKKNFEVTVWTSDLQQQSFDHECFSFARECDK